MSSDARPPVPFRESPIVRPPVGAPRAAAMVMWGAPVDRADAALADAVLRTTLHEFVHTGQRPGHDLQETDRWENEGGSSSHPASRAPDERVIGGRERRARAAHEISHDAVAAAVRAYTRVLRRAGVPLAATLIAVAAAVRGHTASRLSGEACGAVQRDAARACLEAYYGP